MSKALMLVINFGDLLDARSIPSGPQARTTPLVRLALMCEEPRYLGTQMSSIYPSVLREVPHCQASVLGTRCSSLQLQCDRVGHCNATTQSTDRYLRLRAISAVIHGLYSEPTAFQSPFEPLPRPRFFAAWLVLPVLC
jgi:hypothetical protein